MRASSLCEPATATACFKASKGVGAVSISTIYKRDYRSVKKYNSIARYNRCYNDVRR